MVGVGDRVGVRPACACGAALMSSVFMPALKADTPSERSAIAARKACTPPPSAMSREASAMSPPG